MRETPNKPLTLTAFPKVVSRTYSRLQPATLEQFAALSALHGMMVPPQLSSVLDQVQSL